MALEKRSRLREKSLVGLMAPDRIVEPHVDDFLIDPQDSLLLKEIKRKASEEGAVIRSEGTQLHQIIGSTEAGLPFIEHFQWGREEYINAAIDNSGEASTRSDSYDCFVNPDQQSPIAAITLHRIEERGKPSFFLSLLPRKGQSRELIDWVAATQADLAPSDMQYTATLFNEEVAALIADRLGPTENTEINYAKLFSLAPIRQFPRLEVEAQAALLKRLSDDPVLSFDPSIRKAIMQSIYDEVSQSKQPALSSFLSNLTIGHTR